MTDTHIVFVYGTLKAGHSNHGLLQDAEYIGEAETVASEYTMYDLGAFPGVKEGGTDKITGEVYRVNNFELASLHRLEGHPTFYKAKNIAVRLTNKISNNYVSAYMYIYQQQPHKINKLKGTW